MFLNNTLRAVAGLTLLLFLATGCTENKLSESTEAALSAAAADTATDADFEDEDSGPVFITPSPVVIASLFHKSGVPFKATATAAPEAITKLASKPEKSLSLGIYSIDLAYCVLNDQGDQALDHLKTVKALSDGVGLSQAFGSQAIFDRFEANLHQKDSILNLLYLIQEKSNEYLADTEQEDQMVIFFVGAWVESLLLALFSRDSEWNSKTERRVIEQLAFLPSVTEAMAPHGQQNLLYRKINERLLEVQALIPAPELEAGDELTREDIVLSPEAIEPIANNVEALRNLILKV